MEEKAFGEEVTRGSVISKDKQQMRWSIMRALYALTMSVQKVNGFVQ